MPGLPVVRVCLPPAAARLTGLAANDWLVNYPIFHEALRDRATTFGMLPEHAKQAALKRASTDATRQAAALRVLNEVGVSFVELDTRIVDEAVESCLFGHHAPPTTATSPSTSLLDELAAEAPLLHAPRIARPPCLLYPGKSVFLDGLMRFLAYRTRGDATIPLLAADWPDFYERLTAMSC